MTTHIFTEAIDLTEATLDPTNRVLRDVVLIRVGKSKNTTDYSAPVLETAAPVFEGVSAYLDHPDPKNRKPRSLAEFTGVYRNVRFENNALRADRYFSNNQAGRDVMAIAEDVIAGHIPATAVGLSINAAGKARKEDGRLIVEAITAAESVDDVANPAAGGSYRESVQGDGLMAALMETMSYDEWVSARADYAARFEGEHKKVRWNGELKEAKAQVAEYATRVQALEAERQQLQDSLQQVSARALLAEKRVLIVETLAKVSIPASWKKSLTEDLLEADPDQWAGIIERDISKAKSAGHKPRVEVNVPGPQTTPQPTITVTESLAPRDDEDPETWRKRVLAQKQRQGR